MNSNLSIAFKKPQYCPNHAENNNKTYTTLQYLGQIGIRTVPGCLQRLK